MQIQVRINEEGALRNQRYAFTDRFTLISELLQNARRAGATQIEVHHDAATQILKVSDNGRGIDNFQKLLSFNESGWDTSICAKEHPFGVGFSRCLYAASRCIVASGRQSVDFDTVAALAKESIEVMVGDDAEAVAGTQIELHGVDLPDLGSRIGTLCLGFPVPVLFNGKVLERRFAEEFLTTMASPLGTVHLTGALDGEYSHRTVVFLQGFCVMNTGFHPLDKANIVHLDSRQFMARLPDRDKLIDEDVQRARMEAEIKACWRRTLEEAKAHLTPERFVNLYYGAMRSWLHLDLLNDLDVLPAELFRAIAGYPILDYSHSHDYLEPVPHVPTREAIEAGAVTLVDLDPLGHENLALWMMAKAKGYLDFCSSGLHHAHWIQQHVRYLRLETAKVEAIAEQARTELNGRWLWIPVILCQAVRITVNDEAVEITDDGICHEDTLYIPAGETSGEPVRQASYFTDENDRFLEGELDADREDLADLIRHLRSVDPVQTLDSLLQTLNIGKYPLLHGKSFQLSIGMGSALGHSIELVHPDEEVTGAGLAEH